ncbi:hypothetical protein MFIFM68171_07904 [Madurella fahalii]|uniref:Uncharacterized protein n=1 Tax=Madurella fahalii TaxID=1157608 RepID=A0ABQ0GIV9_9PEZI
MDQSPFPAEEVRKFRQVEMNQLNYRRIGAAINGGYTTPDEEDIAKFLKEMEEKKKKEKERFVKWMWIYNGARGEFQPIQVMLDSGSRSMGANFVTPDMVREYRLKPVKIDEVGFKLVNGVYLGCHEQVTFFWRGKDRKDRNVTCLVLPESSPIDMPLLGHDFMVEYGDNLLEEAPGTIAYVTQSEKTLEWVEIAEVVRPAEAEEKTQEQKQDLRPSHKNKKNRRFNRRR